MLSTIYDKWGGLRGGPILPSKNGVARGTYIKMWNEVQNKSTIWSEGDRMGSRHELREQLVVG